MSKQNLYSLQQIAERLKLPQSTVAYYRKNYADFMPSTRVKGKRYPLYEDQAIEVVALVRELSEAGKQQHEIIEELEKKYPSVIDTTGENSTNEQQTDQQSTAILATTQKQSEIISSLIGQQTQLLQAQNVTLEGYKQQTQELADQLEAMTQERQALREKLAELENQARSQKTPPNPQTKPTSRKRQPKPKTTPPEPQEKPKRGGVWSRIFG